MAYGKKQGTHILPVSSVLLFIIMFAIAGLLHAFAAKIENENARETCVKRFANEWILAHAGKTDEEMLQALRTEFKIEGDMRAIFELLESHALKNVCK